MIKNATIATTQTKQSISRNMTNEELIPGVPYSQNGPRPSHIQTADPFECTCTLGGIFGPVFTVLAQCRVPAWRHTFISLRITTQKKESRNNDHPVNHDDGGGDYNNYDDDDGDAHFMAQVRCYKHWLFIDSEAPAPQKAWSRRR